MTSTNLINALRGELIGQPVIAHNNARSCTVEGTIRDETKHTITVETRTGTMKRIIKNENMITLNHHGRAVHIDGATMSNRGEDRLKMKVSP